MQPLARDGLTAAQVQAIFEADELYVDASCELVDIGTGARSDVTDDFVPARSSVSYDMDSAQVFSARLGLTLDVDWGNVLAAPSVTVSAGGNSATFPLGGFELTTPVQVQGEDPRVLDVEAYGLRSLLRWHLGAAHRVAASTDVVSEVRDLLDDAGLGALTLSAPGDAASTSIAQSWPADTPYIQVIDDLLASVGWDRLTSSPTVGFETRPLQAAEDRAIEYTYGTGATTELVEPGARTTRDTWEEPNQWVFSWTEAPDRDVPANGAGRYVVDNLATGPMAQGLISRVRSFVLPLEAATHSALQVRGEEVVTRQMGSSVTRELVSGLVPAHWHSDIIRGPDDDGVVRRWQVARWSIPSLADGAMSQTWRRVIEGGVL